MRATASGAYRVRMEKHAPYLPPNESARVHLNSAKSAVSTLYKSSNRPDFSAIVQQTIGSGEERRRNLYFLTLALLEFDKPFTGLWSVLISLPEPQPPSAEWALDLIAVLDACIKSGKLPKDVKLAWESRPFGLSDEDYVGLFLPKWLALASKLVDAKLLSAKELDAAVRTILAGIDPDWKTKAETVCTKYQLDTARSSKRGFRISNLTTLSLGHLSPRKEDKTPSATPRDDAAQLVLDVINKKITDAATLKNTATFLCDPSLGTDWGTQRARQFTSYLTGLVAGGSQDAGDALIILIDGQHGSSICAMLVSGGAIGPRWHPCFTIAGFAYKFVGRQIGLGARVAVQSVGNPDDRLPTKVWTQVAQALHDNEKSNVPAWWHVVMCQGATGDVMGLVTVLRWLQKTMTMMRVDQEACHRLLSLLTASTPELTLVRDGLLVLLQTQQVAADQWTNLQGQFTHHWQSCHARALSVLLLLRSPNTPRPPDAFINAICGALLDSNDRATCQILFTAMSTPIEVRGLDSETLKLDLDFRVGWHVLGAAPVLVRMNDYPRLMALLVEAVTSDEAKKTRPVALPPKQTCILACDVARDLWRANSDTSYKLFEFFKFLEGQQSTALLTTMLELLFPDRLRPPDHLKLLAASRRARKALVWWIYGAVTVSDDPIGIVRQAIENLMRHGTLDFVHIKVVQERRSLIEKKMGPVAGNVMGGLHGLKLPEDVAQRRRTMPQIDHLLQTWRTAWRDALLELVNRFGIGAVGLLCDSELLRNVLAALTGRKNDLANVKSDDIKELFKVAFPEGSDAQQLPVLPVPGHNDLQGLFVREAGFLKFQEVPGLCFPALLTMLDQACKVQSPVLVASLQKLHSRVKAWMARAGSARSFDLCGGFTIELPDKQSLSCVLLGHKLAPGYAQGGQQRDVDARPPGWPLPAVRGPQRTRHLRGELVGCRHAGLGRDPGVVPAQLRLAAQVPRLDPDRYR